MTTGDLTLSQIQGQLRVFMPDLAARIDMELSTTYEEFVKNIQYALDRSISYIEENPGVRLEDSEDRTTIEIVGNLQQRGYDADHDTKVNGHVDIVIRHRAGYQWLGEAKKGNGYTWVHQGFEQLCTRYSRGTPDQNQGGILIYIRTKNAKSFISKWKDHLTSHAEWQDLRFEECTEKPGLYFYTEHRHDSSGLTYRVRHMGIVLHHDPKA